MPLVKYEVPYAALQRSFSTKFISAAVDADLGDANAMIVSPSRDMERRGHEVGSVRFVNASGSARDMALAVRLRQAEWVAGQVTAAGVYTDDTTDAQDIGTADFSMHDRTDSGSGFLVGASVPWNALGLVQAAAGDQTTPVFITEYWNGTAWTNIQSSLLIGTATTNLLNGDGTGEKVQLFEIPAGWVIGGTPTATVPQTTYNIRFRVTHSGAGTADPTASQLFVGVAAFHEAALASNTESLTELSHPYRFPREGDALFHLCEVADAAIYAQVQHRFYW